MNIYFAASIRGGRGDVSWYNSLIEHCKRAGSVLTEHIGKPSIEAMGETGVSESFIYTRDVDWLADAHAVVAEVTQPSLGVGYELGFAEAHRIPTLCLFRTGSDRSLSAMIRGCPRFDTHDYSTLDEAYARIDDFLATVDTTVKPASALKESTRAAFEEAAAAERTRVSAEAGAGAAGDAAESKS